MDGALSPGDLLVFAAYLKELYGPIDKFSEIVVDLAQAVVSGERLVELVETPVVVKDGQGRGGGAAAEAATSSSATCTSTTRRASRCCEI